MISANAAVTAARQGREALAVASVSLQTAGFSEPRLERAVEDTAAASSALYSAEAASPTEEAAIAFIHSAADALQRAMVDVNALRQPHPQLEVAATSIARTLALLYPVLHHSLRQRRGRLPAGGLSDSDARELRTMAGFPRAPSPTGRFRRPSDFDGSDRRADANKRVFVEVEIGLSSESHIYTGLSLDVSTGGVFVATYEPARSGTAVRAWHIGWPGKGLPTCGTSPAASSCGPTRTGPSSGTGGRPPRCIPTTTGGGCCSYPEFGPTHRMSSLPSPRPEVGPGRLR